VEEWPNVVDPTAQFLLSSADEADDRDDEILPCLSNKNFLVKDVVVGVTIPPLRTRGDAHSTFKVSSFSFSIHARNGLLGRGSEDTISKVLLWRCFDSGWLPMGSWSRSQVVKYCLEVPHFQFTSIFVEETFSSFKMVTSPGAPVEKKDATPLRV
jgi:hypothetical protein